MQAIPYFLQDTTDSWYQSLVNKPQDFNAFKIEFLRYFNNNNSINRLVNIFTTIKQGENEAVTTYLGCFHRNLHQIQAIDANYFTVVQILNQFIRRLHSSILQCVYSIHPVDLQAVITNARDFEAAELEANHAQAVNLVMNGSSELDSKLKQFKTRIAFRISCVHHRQPINSGNRKCMFKINIKTPITTILSELLTYNTAAILLTTSISNANLSTNNTGNLSATATTHVLAAVSAGSQQWNSSTGYTQNPNSQNYLSLLVTPENAQPNNLETNQHPTLTSNIPPATITENESLDAIFLFELKKPSTMPLFSKAALEKKPITAIYTDAKVDGHSIKLILNSGSAGSIITKQLMDQLGR
ncbi:hypothetical protein G9A89_000904 [Geosiphon pyriformis]|nr:hypothetical protein G9A89_000904 [Geosiphon pyriformis]